MQLKTTKTSVWWSFAFIFFLFFIGYNQANSASHKTQTATKKEIPATLLEYLTQEKTQLSAAVTSAKQSVPPKDEISFNKKMEQASASLIIIAAKIESLDSFLDNEKKQEAYLNQRLKHLQQLPLASAEISIQERVAKVEKLLTISHKITELINENTVLANQLSILLNEEVKRLKFWKENFELEQKLVLIKSKKTKLNQELSVLYLNNSVQENKHKPPRSALQNPTEYQATILINNQNIALIHHRLNSLSIQKKVVKTDILLLNNSDTKTLQFVVDSYRDALNQCSNIEKSLQQLQTSVNKESSFMSNLSLKKPLNLLVVAIKQQLDEINLQKNVLTKGLENYQNQLKKLISSRQSLAEYNINSWPVIINKIIAIPTQLYNYLKILSLKVFDSYGWLDIGSTIFLWTSLVFIFVFLIVLNRFLKTLIGNKERSRLTGYLYDGVLVIVQRNIPYICLFAMLWTVFYFTNISFSNYQLLINLIFVWFTFRVLILIARLVLLERISDSSGKDVKLYYRLKWLFLFGGWADALMVLGHLLPLAIIVQDLFNRLFMLFILAVSLVIWKSKDVIPYLLKPLVMGKKRYIKNAVALLVVLTPITLFTTALIGLLGFINLAWTMSGYQAYILLILVAYILARGLVFDALELLSEWMISALENGWLWIEVFLKPIDKILRIILLLFSIFILFQIFGWHSDSMVMINLSKLAKYTIVNFTGVYITIASVIEFFIVLAIFVWAAKWTREFCYRWLFKNTKDVGIRNSLSVFTQYAVILLGVFITLHVLGLDLSGMSMILGGLAVGMGFGLRDFASNIVGGIMLLIERPVREGDVITLGEYEGRVAHIGIRSMRVSSWDNMEVLIPNAETFNKPFTNWTLQDSIVRTVVPIKVCRSDDPVMIQQLILDILLNVPEIVPDPPPQVFLKKIDEALIEFEARYFINVQIYTRVEVKSKVLFAITAEFKARGVRPPIEPVSIELKEGYREFFTKNDSSSEDGA